MDKRVIGIGILATLVFLNVALGHPSAKKRRADVDPKVEQEVAMLEKEGPKIVFDPDELKDDDEYDDDYYTDELIFDEVKKKEAGSKKIQDEEKRIAKKDSKLPAFGIVKEEEEKKRKGIDAEAGFDYKRPLFFKPEEKPEVKKEVAKEEKEHTLGFDIKDTPFYWLFPGFEDGFKGTEVKREEEEEKKVEKTDPKVFYSDWPFIDYGSYPPLLLYRLALLYGIDPSVLYEHLAGEDSKVRKTEDIDHTKAFEHGKGFDPKFKEEKKVKKTEYKSCVDYAKK